MPYSILLFETRDGKVKARIDWDQDKRVYLGPVDSLAALFELCRLEINTQEIGSPEWSDGPVGKPIC